MCQCIVLADVLTGDLTRCHHISSFIVQTSGAAYECISCCQWKLPATNMESSDDEPSEWPIYLWLLLLKCILSDREYRATFDCNIENLFRSWKNGWFLFIFFQYPSDRFIRGQAPVVSFVFLFQIVHSIIFSYIFIYSYH